MFEDHKGQLFMHTQYGTLTVILTLLIVACVFDPGDKIFHIKVPLFFLSWLIFFAIIMIKNNKLLFGLHSLAFVYIMLFIPLVSIAYYTIFNGSEPYDGYIYFKSYLFITLVLILSVTKIDLIPRLCWVLTFLSLSIIAISILIINRPDIETFIYVSGLDYGNISMGNREYGEIGYKTFFYMTSLMIVMPITYFTYKTITSNGKKRILYAIVALVNIYGMFLGGTRNNMLVSILSPLLIIYWYSKQRKIVFFIILIFISVVCFSFYHALGEMFSRSDVSNDLKIGYLPDYYNILLSDNLTLLFGQGLGSYAYWTVLKGTYASITELTFFELFRNYGLIGGPIVLFTIMFPLKDLFDKSKKNIHYLLLGYLSYIFMSLFNPIFFSSSGMLLLSIIAVKTLSMKSKLPLTLSAD